jgi:hypothetical protein
MHETGRIDDDTWNEWSDGILTNLRRPGFAAAWMRIDQVTGSSPDPTSRSFDALRRFLVAAGHDPEESHRIQHEPWSVHKPTAPED